MRSSTGHVRKVWAAVAVASAFSLCAACGSGVSVPAGQAPSGSSNPSLTAPTTPAAPTASSPTSPSAAPGTSSKTSTSGPQLPGGGRRIFPDYRMVGYVGYPGSTALGQLGIGNLDSEVDALIRRGHPYTDGRKLMPVLELIAVVVQGAPGPSGDYRSRVSPAVIQRYLDAARRHHAMLLLDVQPGRSDFLTEVTALDPWLTQSDVGLALDPEWAMAPGQVPGRRFGSVTGAELDAVGAHVSAIVRRHDLPQKAIVYHQVARSVVRDEADLKRYPGVAWVKSVDGIGSPAQKISTYRGVNARTPSFVHAGFKLFFHEDRRHGALMSPRQVLALDPRPEFVMYE